MNISIRGVCGKFLFDIMVMRQKFPRLMSNEDEFDRLGELLLNTLLNFDGQTLENDINLPVEYSNDYKNSSAIINKEDLTLYENRQE